MREDLKPKINKAAQILKQGGVVVLPFDTCYGLSTNIENEECVQKIFNIKKRNKAKTISIVCKDILMAKKYVQISTKQEETINNLYTTPHTFILQKKENVTLHKGLVNKTGGTGVRVIRNNLFTEIFKYLDFALTSTSANISTLPSTYSINDLKDQYKQEIKKIDYILDIGILNKVETSTLIDLRKIV